MTPTEAPETRRCVSCHDTTAPMGMCDRCGVFGTRQVADGMTLVPTAQWEALHPYLRHQNGCGVWKTPRAEEGPTDARCTCGLRAALEGAGPMTTPRTEPLTHTERTWPGGPRRDPECSGCGLPSASCDSYAPDRKCCPDCEHRAALEGAKP